MSLLSIDDIAVRVGESREYVRDKIVKRADFPRPSLVLSRKVVKWSLVDFEAWLEKKRKEWAK